MRIMRLLMANFNPRSHKGSDHYIGQIVLDPRDFNPRSHKGSDSKRFSLLRLCQIDFNPRSHKGSDGYVSAEYSDENGFQSTLPQGERQKSLVESQNTQIFQSTLPQGERRDAGKLPGQRDVDFNPRSHKGSDGHIIIWAVHRYKISIHAPTRGATQMTNLKRIREEFQSTLPQGERLCINTITRNRSNFNPRSHKGSDLRDHLLPDRISYFNPRSHKGSDGAQVQQP